MFDTLLTIYYLLMMPDPEASVQEQALALVRNLVDGSLNSIDYVFGEDGLLLHTIGRQLRNTAKAEVLIQVRSFSPCLDIRAQGYEVLIH